VPLAGEAANVAGAGKYFRQRRKLVDDVGVRPLGEFCLFRTEVAVNSMLRRP